jgi:hypothetical protein
MNAKKKKTGGIERTGRLKVHGSFIIGYLARQLGHMPTADELSRFTKAEPEMFPKPGWSVDEAQWVLDNPDALLEPTDAEAK